jgi:hypothetical protein
MPTRHQQHPLLPLQEEQEATASTLEAAQQQLAALKEAHSKQGLEMQANARSLQAAAQEEKLREKAELKEHLERCCLLALLPQLGPAVGSRGFWHAPHCLGRAVLWAAAGCMLAC